MKCCIIAAQYAILNKSWHRIRLYALNALGIGMAFQLKQKHMRRTTKKNKIVEMWIWHMTEQAWCHRLDEINYKLHSSPSQNISFHYFFFSFFTEKKTDSSPDKMKYFRHLARSSDNLSQKIKIECINLILIKWVCVFLFFFFNFGWGTLVTFDLVIKIANALIRTT